ncbi:Fatty acid desaturase [Candidatus Rhodobacter oscarellae]|uniref:Fatty acid desaturase n=1 Tax=Candidatus Rhodobacter oscarellae TaxID=1675527 RepID=A0A0J9E4E6_9RHOB|nr:fatty acid desaturase [Candidatus Rhodobacter lobularis]KMW57602.1 Fatty acid desaturase [Candidatus Rhodobacter lobularis]
MDIREYLKAFTQKDNRIASLSFFGTFAAFFPGLYFAARIVDAGYWWAAAPFVMVVTFGLTRLYVLQHDLGHYSLFERKWQNDWAGVLASIFTFTPYRTGQYNHNMHHAYLGNLDHRDTTEIFTMTKREWDAADWKTRLGYRLYRNPAILIPVGGLFTYFIAYRWPKNAAKIGVAGVLAHNALMFTWFGLLYLWLGWAGLGVLAVAAVIAANMGVFMVFLQHNFEDTYWERKPDLDFRMATLQGSSCLDLGHWWDIGTCNIAYHDIHHFMPAIPSYRLRKAHHGMPEHLALRRIKWPEAFASFRLKLWDEEAKRLVPFPKSPKAAAIPAE